MERALEKIINEEVNTCRDCRAWFLWIFVALGVASSVVLRTSIMTTSVRLLLVATLLLGVLNAVLFYIRLTKSHTRMVYPSVFFLVFFLMWTVLGNKPHDTDMLRSYYKNRLHNLQNVKYVWGGETNTGIDCSGLARTALWQAMLKQGLMQANPRLLGPTLWKFWFTDLAAKDLLAEKHGYTRVIGKADKLAGYDTSRLEVGDMAVTNDGKHVLIYYGEGKWIDAAPDFQKVVVNKAPADSTRGWFNVQVVFVRWWILDKE